MKIAIDALPLMHEKSGIGNYTHHLLVEFQKLAPENDYYLTDIISRNFFANTFRAKPGGSDADMLFTAFRAPFPFMTLTRYLLFLMTSLNGKNESLDDVDIFFGTNYRAVFDKNIKTVLTVHDMAQEYFPETINSQTLEYFKKDFPKAVMQADMLIADSENTKRDIVNILKVPESRIRVIYLGIDDSFAPVTDEATLLAIKKRYRLPDKFILFVGAIQPRKNIEGLLRSYAMLVGSSRVCHDLVLAGGKGWKSEGLQRLVNDLGLKERVHFTGYVDAADLPGLYTLADLFTFPSFYEGFGLPVIEAMACGVPVVTANTSCFPEITGGATLMVDPHSVEDLAEGICRMLSDIELREKFIAAGLVRSKLFNWEKCARETLEVLHEVMKS